jgi:hypothetical protein
MKKSQSTFRAIFSWKHARKIFEQIKKSKITLGLLGGLLTAIVVGKRDAYFHQEETFRTQRAVLINEYSTLRKELEGPLIQSTYGFLDYALDLERVSLGGKWPVIPAEVIPADQEEAIKGKIREQQKALWTVLSTNAERRERISHLIQNFTRDERIEAEWILIDTALSFLPGEDRFLSTLAQEEIRLNRKILSMRKWNRIMGSTEIQNAQRDFIKRSSMAFRVYFYQDFIRSHLRQLDRLVLREQAGDASLIPQWLTFRIFPRPIPPVSEKWVVDTMIKEHNLLRNTYLDRADQVDILIEAFKNYSRLMGERLREKIPIRKSPLL